MISNYDQQCSNDSLALVFSSRPIKMSPRFVLRRENVPCVAEVVNRSLKADCTDFTQFFVIEIVPSAVLSLTDYLKQEIFYISPDVYSICCILTFCNQAVPDQVMTCSKCVTQAAYDQRFQAAYNLKS